METERKTFLVPNISTIVLILTPLLLLFLPIFLPGKESLCAYIILLVSIYWATGCLPLGLTGLLPVILFPAMGILTNKQMTEAYFFPGMWLFFGSIIFAIALQSNNLHLRIALKLLLAVGTKPKRLLLGLMITCVSLSMLIPNLAVVAMIMPIVESILKEIELQLQESPMKKENDASNGLQESRRISKDEGATASSLLNNHLDTQITFQDQEHMKKFSIAITLCVPYACAVGGICTLTGSIPNVATVAMLKQLFPDSPEISYSTWFLYYTPPALLTSVVMYVWMMWLYLGFRNDESNSINQLSVKHLLKKRYKDLGPIRWNEKCAIFLLVITTILWLTRNPGFVTGWGALLKGSYINDSTVVMATSFLLFVIPKEKPIIYGYKSDTPESKNLNLLTWKEFETRFPWEILFIFGGGITLAAGANVSGLSHVLQRAIPFFSNFQPWVICLILTVLMSFLTECVSGLAVVTLMLPILKELSNLLHVHPFYLSLPPTFSMALAFMLPIGTPPNALAYTFGYYKTKDMIKTGWLLNLVGIVMINITVNTYGKLLLGLDIYPSWAESLVNITQADNIINQTTAAGVL